MPILSIIQRMLRRYEPTQPAAPALYDKAAARFELSEQKSVWDHPAWLEVSADYVQRLRREEVEDCLAPEAYLAPIALLASQVARNQGMVKILDLGGGGGTLRRCNCAETSPIEICGGRWGSQLRTGTFDVRGRSADSLCRKAAG